MKVRNVLLLMVSYGIYLIVGASVFQGLEYPREEKMCQETIDELKKFNLTRSKFMQGDANTESMKRLVRIILTSSSNGVQFDSLLNPSCAHNWNFVNSFFFAGTVVSTIGYGNIAPATREGRYFCIFYAVIGLPLFGIMFREVGAIFAGFFNKLEGRLRKRVSNAKLRHCCVLLALLTTLTVFFLIIPAFIFGMVEKWTYPDAFYYSIITLTTIGFGDFIAGINPDLSYSSVYRVAVYFWILFGLAFMAAVINVISELIKGSANEELNSDPVLCNCHRKVEKTTSECSESVTKSTVTPSINIVVGEDV